MKTVLQLCSLLQVLVVVVYGIGAAEAALAAALVKGKDGAVDAGAMADSAIALAEMEDFFKAAAEAMEVKGSRYPSGEEGAAGALDSDSSSSLLSRTDSTMEGRVYRGREGPVEQLELYKDGGRALEPLWISASAEKEAAGRNSH